MDKRPKERLSLAKIRALEDAEDLKAFRERRNEPSIPFEEVVRRLQREGLLPRRKLRPHRATTKKGHK